MSPTVPPISTITTSTSFDLLDGRLDFIGDVGDHLHRFAQVIPAPFLLDNGLINPAGSPVVVLGETDYS